MGHINNLTNAEIERLSLIITDIGKLQSAIGNVLLTGYSDNLADKNITNRDHLTQAIANLQCSLGLLIGSRDIDPEKTQHYIDISVKNIADFLTYHTDNFTDLVNGQTIKEVSLGKNVIRLFKAN